MEGQMKDRVEQLTDYIMKHCLWQFHSRAWDRKAQNLNILGKTCELLSGEKVCLETPADRCYWVDAVTLAEAYRTRYTWINGLAKPELKELFKNLHEHIDYLTVDGSLNEELKDQHY